MYVIRIQDLSMPLISSVFGASWLCRWVNCYMYIFHSRMVPLNFTIQWDSCNNSPASSTGLKHRMSYHCWLIVHASRCGDDSGSIPPRDALHVLDFLFHRLLNRKQTATNMQTKTEQEKRPLGKVKPSDLSHKRHNMTIWSKFLPQFLFKLLSRLIYF